jgi:hypothetical protein
MRRSNSLLLALCLASAGASASCPRPVACYDIVGLVASCSSVQVDGAPYLKLTLPKHAAELVECGLPPLPEDRRNDVAEGIAWYTSHNLFFVRDSEGTSCTELSGSPMRARILEECCDTFPLAGECALGGPLVVPAPK